MFYLTIPFAHDAGFPLNPPPDFLCIWEAVVLGQVPLLAHPALGALLCPGAGRSWKSLPDSSTSLRVLLSSHCIFYNFFNFELLRVRSREKLPHVLLARFPFKTELFISDRFSQARKTCYISSSRGCFGILYLYDSIKLSVMRMNNSKNCS